MKDKITRKLRGVTIERNGRIVKVTAILSGIGALGSLLLNIRAISVWTIITIVTCLILTFVCLKKTTWTGWLLMAAFAISGIYQIGVTISAFGRFSGMIWPCILAICNFCLCAYLLGLVKTRYVPIAASILVVSGTLYLRIRALWNFLAASSAINHANELISGFVPSAPVISQFLLPAHFSAILKVWPYAIMLVLLVSKRLNYDQEETIL